MRVSPAIWVKGRIAREVPEVRNDRLAKETAGSGPAACLHVRYVDDFVVRNLNEANDLGISMFKTWSGLSSNDGRGSNPLPARSDGLDNVDGGPDAAFYIQIGII